jgi:hypothetical protein
VIKDELKDKINDVELQFKDEINGAESRLTKEINEVRTTRRRQRLAYFGLRSALSVFL